MSKIITREVADRFINEIASELAKEYNCKNFFVGEDRQKGIWSEEFTKFLEAQHGQCTEQIKFTGYNDDYIISVETRYKFSSPAVCIRFKNRHVKSEDLAEMCLSGYNPDKQDWSSEYHISDFQCFNSRGLDLAQDLRERWNNKVKEFKGD